MTALELIKAQLGGVEALILIVDDPIAQRVVAAWPMIGNRIADRPLNKKETFKEAHDSLWLDAKVDFELLARQSDVPFTRCFGIFNRLARAGIVYPDGTISKPAQDLLFGRAQAYIRGMISKRTRNAR